MITPNHSSDRDQAIEPVLSSTTRLAFCQFLMMLTRSLALQRGSWAVATKTLGRPLARNWWCVQEDQNTCISFLVRRNRSLRTKGRIGLIIFSLVLEEDSWHTATLARTNQCNHKRGNMADTPTSDVFVNRGVSNLSPLHTGSPSSPS